MKMLFSSSLRVLKQTKNPPKRLLPLKDNPLARWSKRLPSHWKTSSTEPTLPGVSVGLEGCESAFNATNSIRTCWYFQTGVPPRFLRLQKWEDIEHLQHRDAEEDEVGMTAVGEDAEHHTSLYDKAHREISGEENGMEDVTSNNKSRNESGGRVISGSGMAMFGEEYFFACPEKEKNRIIALENFSPSSQSIFRYRFSSHCSLIIGHENDGVDKRVIQYSACTGSGQNPNHSKERMKTESAPSTVKEEKVKPSMASSASVVYIPQYGTISSLNVVTAMGIGLFYVFLDSHFPGSRTILTQDAAITDMQKKRFAPLLEYQRFFVKALPTATSSSLSNTSENPSTPSRVDARPIHPIFYKKDGKEIFELLRQHREWLLQLSSEERGTSRGNASEQPLKRFGLSVLYENEFDLRNFGGLIRNCNAFLVDKLCYIGRKKYNVVGSVGSYHYTPPQYLGLGFETIEAEKATRSENHKNDDNSTSKNSEEKEHNTVASAVEKVLADYKVDAQRQRIIRLASWSLHLREKVNTLCGGPCQWWLLDCGHHPFYAEDFTFLQDELRRRKGKEDFLENASLPSSHRSSIESLRWFLSHYSDGDFVLHLTEPEEKIREAAGAGVVLLVPQEGKLPHISLLMQCERILSIVPPTLDGDAVKTTTGLPSQVASGIALQRLSAILHPKLCEL